MSLLNARALPKEWELERLGLTAHKCRLVGAPGTEEMKKAGRNPAFLVGGTLLTVLSCESVFGLILDMAWANCLNRNGGADYLSCLKTRFMHGVCQNIGRPRLKLDD